MDQKLKDQVAIVTGASSGIGAGTSLELAKAGATVVVNYPFEGAKDAAEAVVSQIKGEGGNAVSHQCDVSKEAEVVKMFADTVSQFGTVDILINNAGLQKDSPFTEMSLDTWNFVLSVNLNGQFLCAREAVKEFLRRGVKPERSVANYAASKGGIMMMMKTIAQEFAPKKVRINSIAPGAIKTPINQAAWGTPEGMKNLLRLIPYKRIGDPADIGKAAVWLASDDSDYVNGTTLFIDGGMTLYPGFEDNG